MNTSPVKILGAGPAGMAAAITLAKAGRSVEVIDRAADCGTRFLGDLQGLENWSRRKDVVEELAEMGIDVNFDCDPFDSVIETNGRRTETLALARPAFYLVRRGVDEASLDQGLKRQALDAGVEISFRRTLPLAEIDIAATGPVAKEIFAVAKGIVFRTDAPDMAVGLLNDRAALGGYAYLLVTRGYGCLSTVLFDRFNTVKSCYDKSLEMLSEQFSFRIEEPKSVGGVGHFSSRAPFQTGRILFVGEAAGIQDLLWGFGIRSSIQSGVLAARSFLGGGSFIEASKAAFRKGMKASVVNRFLWEVLKRRDYSFVLSLMKRYDVRLLHSFYRFNPIQRLLYLPALLYVRQRYPQLQV